MKFYASILATTLHGSFVVAAETDTGKAQGISQLKTTKETSETKIKTASKTAKAPPRRQVENAPDGGTLNGQSDHLSDAEPKTRQARLLDRIAGLFIDTSESDEPETTNDSTTNDSSSNSETSDSDSAYQFLGSGRLFYNDFFGDGRDRWRSGSFSYSRLYATKDLELSSDTAFGDLLEARLRTTLITPSNADVPLGDRPYVGALSAGVQSHIKHDNYTNTFGGELTLVGPQTGVSKLQERFHRLFDMPLPPHIDKQLPDDLIASAFYETRKTIELAQDARLHPFISAMVGEEDIARFGVDLRYGTYDHQQIWSRDVTSGQLYALLDEQTPGWALSFGADVGLIGSSYFLPENRSNGPKSSRYRVRAGAEYRFENGVRVSYQPTYLSPEIKGQERGQLISAVTVNLNW